MIYANNDDTSIATIPVNTLAPRFPMTEIALLFWDVLAPADEEAEGIGDVNVAVARKLAHDASDALGAITLDAVVPFP